MAGQQAPVVTGPALWIHTPAVSSQAATDQGEGGTLYPLLRQQFLG
jgi:hypothetical protein